MAGTRGEYVSIALRLGLLGWLVLAASPALEVLLVTLTGPPCTNCALAQSTPWLESAIFWLRTIVLDYGLGAASLGLVLSIFLLATLAVSGVGLILMKLGKVAAGSAALFAGSFVSFSLAEGFVVGPSLMLAASIVGFVSWWKARGKLPRGVETDVQAAHQFQP